MRLCEVFTRLSENAEDPAKTAMAGKTTEKTLDVPCHRDPQKGVDITNVI